MLQRGHAVADFFFQLAAHGPVGRFARFQDTGWQLDQPAGTLVVGRDAELLGKNQRVLVDLVNDRRHAVPPVEV